MHLRREHRSRRHRLDIVDRAGQQRIGFLQACGVGREHHRARIVVQRPNMRQGLRFALAGRKARQVQSQARGPTRPGRVLPVHRMQIDDPCDGRGGSCGAPPQRLGCLAGVSLAGRGPRGMKRQAPGELRQNEQVVLQRDPGDLGSLRQVLVFQRRERTLAQGPGALPQQAQPGGTSIGQVAQLGLKRGHIRRRRLDPRKPRAVLRGSCAVDVDRPLDPLEDPIRAAGLLEVGCQPAEPRERRCNPFGGVEIRRPIGREQAGLPKGCGFLAQVDECLDLGDRIRA